MVAAPETAALRRSLAARGASAALWWRGTETTAARLLDMIDVWSRRLADAGIGAGTVCAIGPDFSPELCAALLALMGSGAVVVPLTRAARSESRQLLEIGAVERTITFDRDDRWDIATFGLRTVPELLARFKRDRHPGLIVFTSGSTGRPKGILHDFERILKKYRTPRPGYRTLQFLLLDHFGGMNTFLSVLSSGGVAVLPDERTPQEIVRVVEQARVELMPVTPTFLNLLVASGAVRGRDLSSVKVITYGTEVMPDALLRRLPLAFPNARLQQTYGLSEVSVLGSRSRESASLWLKVGGSGFETRVVDGVLHVRSEYAMVGYLNAPSPFDEEGWMNTGDVVIEDGEWLRILGRSSDLINVGGQKVFPAEVESVLLEADNVLDATVRGEPHELMGSVVVADVRLAEPEEPTALRERLRAFCLERLARYKIPVRFNATIDIGAPARFKKARRLA